MAKAMQTTQALTQRFEMVFDPRQSRVLAEVITDAYSDLVKTGDFNELKAIVRDLAVAQQRTEARMEELAAAQDRLTVAQDRLTVAQERTETSLDRLTQVVTRMGRELGTVTQTMSYALENEAYRMLPMVLERDYGIRLQNRIVRAEIEGVEVNFFAHGERDGQAICLVGEVKLRLDERDQKRWKALLEQLDRQAKAVKQQYPDCETVQLLVTHFARSEMLKQAQDRGLLVVQSFEW